MIPYCFLLFLCPNLFQMPFMKMNFQFVLCSLNLQTFACPNSYTIVPWPIQDPLSAHSSFPKVQFNLCKKQTAGP